MTARPLRASLPSGAFVLAAVACALAALASLAVPRPGAPHAGRTGSLVGDAA